MRPSFLWSIFLFAFLLQPVFVGAQTTTPSPTSIVASDPYTSKTLLDQARKQCQSAIATGGVSSVFNDDGAQIFLQKSLPAISGGGGQVSVYDIGAIRQLNYIAWISSTNEALLRERNFADDCFKALAIANAQKGLVKDLSKTQKRIVERDLTNKERVAEKVGIKTYEKGISGIDQADDTKYPFKSEIKNSVAKVLERQEDDQGYTLSKAEVYAKANGSSRFNINDFKEIAVDGNNPYTQSVKTIQFLRNKAGDEVGQVYDEARISGGITADRICTKTTSGANPEDVDFESKDCESWTVQPLFINQEKAKQLVNAPYNQAFSPSAELGLDGALSNLNTRIGNGTLFSQNVGENFGAGSATNTSLLDAEKIKNQLINPATSTPAGSVTLGILIHEAVVGLYESSTSSCIYVPITERQATLIEAKVKKAELETYKKDLTTKWAEVVANPKLDYTNFFLKLSIDFSNKYSKTWLEQLLNDAKDKATKCATAKANYTPPTTSTSTNPNVTVTTP